MKQFINKIILSLFLECFNDNGIASLDDLIVHTELPTTKLASLLLNLEFDGILKALPGKRYQRC